MNIFLTGGGGYIGSAAAAALLKAGHSVTVYDSLVTGYKEAIPEEARFVHADLGDQEKVSSTLKSERYDAIMHFAAFIEAGESMRDPGKYFYNNLVLSIHLIEAAIKTEIPRFVLSSTAAVYASSDDPLTEGAPLGPTNVYGQTKLMIEQALNWYNAVHGLKFAALRYFNAAGAYPSRGEAHQPESHLIPLVLQVALGQREEIHIPQMEPASEITSTLPILSTRTFSHLRHWAITISLFTTSGMALAIQFVKSSIPPGR
jgi:UDP-glucose 4-epimerase